MAPAEECASGGEECVGKMKPKQGRLARYAPARCLTVLEASWVKIATPGTICARVAVQNILSSVVYPL